MRLLLFLLFTCSISAKGFYAVQPSFLTSGVHVGYNITLKEWPKAALHNRRELGIHLSLFPVQRGVAPAYSNALYMRFNLSKMRPQGFGVALFSELEALINPIYYREEKIERDLLFSCSPGITIDWQCHLKEGMHLLPYMRGLSRFYLSTQYPDGVRIFWGFDVGLSLLLDRSFFPQRRKLKEKSSSLRQ